MEINRSEQELVRRGKLDSIREYCNPYPEKYEITHSIKDARNLSDGTENVKIAGRIIFLRKMGKLSFMRIRDIEASIQVSMQLDLVGEEAYKFVDWLHEAKMSIWQVLPLVPTNYGDSPYQSVSSTAVNYYLIDFDITFIGKKTAQNVPFSISFYNVLHFEHSSPLAVP